VRFHQLKIACSSVHRILMYTAFEEAFSYCIICL
jgi:hypothetical protein